MNKKFGLFRTTVTPRAYAIVFTDVTAIREGIQNMLDAYDQAGDVFDPKKHVQYLEKTQRLVLWSPLTIPRAAMLQGYTTKEDGNSRGRYGEGLKAMCAVLGERVRIETEGENWSPRLVDSDVVPGEKVLAFAIRKAGLTGGPFTKVIISDVSPDMWQAVKRLCRPLQDKGSKPMFEGAYGQVLKDLPEQVFSKGLLVGKWDGARYGYDLPELHVNRDRKDVAEYHIREAAERVLLPFCVERPEECLSMLEDDTKEAETIAMLARWYTGAQAGLAKAWKEKYGEKVICMSSEDDPFRSMAATGWRPVYGNKHLRGAIAAALGGEDKLLLEARDSIAAEFPLYALTEHERDVYRKGMAMAQVAAREAYPDEFIMRDKPSYHIVRFHGESVRGLCDWKDKRISVRRDMLEDLPQFLRVLTHEMAHYYSNEPDGAIGHTTAIEVMNMHLLKGCGL